jgi:DNA ligase-1
MRIPHFNVQLANDYDGHRGKYYASPKLHGARALGFRTDEGKWELYSRNGNRWETMSHIERELEEKLAALDITFLDGELYCQEMEFEEIQSATRSVRVKHPRVEEIGYFIFWVGDKEDFFEKKAISTEDGLEKLRQLEETLHMGWHVEEPRTFEFLPYVEVDLPEDAVRIRLLFVSHGFEGAVYRHRKVGYDYRRSDFLLKDKPFKEEDFRCVGFEEGEGKNTGSLGAIIVELDSGQQCKVGTGFTDEMRDEVWKNKDFFLGKYAEVKYGKISRYGKLIEPSFRNWKLDRD